MIVSNDICNDVSPVVEVIFLTSRRKNRLPTHVMVECELYSTALCEQITSVDKTRLLEYVGRASPTEMEQINEALKISLGIGGTGEEMGEVIVIEGIGIPIKEFCGQRVMTLKDIDVVHKRPNGTAGRYFNQNKTKFNEKKDFFIVDFTDKEKCQGLGFWTSQPNTKVITRSGYEVLTRNYLFSEKDIKIRDEVIDSYFTVADSAAPEEPEEEPIGTTTMEEQDGLMVFENKTMGIQLRTTLNSDGSISVSAEDTAIGFGWVREKSGKDYVMWDRFNSFCEELGFPHKCGKEDYIPESLYYLLGMKANNERAQKFQRWLALDVIPQIRKTGSYKSEPKRPEKLEEALKTEDPEPQRITEYEPGVYLEAAKIAAQLPESREHVLNCLRHVVPDIDVTTQPVHEIVEVKTELTTKQTETVKVKQTQTQKTNPQPKYFKVGVPCDVAKLRKTMERRNISESRMALMSELSITTVKNILAEKHQPTIETRTKFCRALKVSDDYLTPGGGA